MRGFTIFRGDIPDDVYGLIFEGIRKRENLKCLIESLDKNDFLWGDLKHINDMASDIVTFNIGGVIYDIEYDGVDTYFRTFKYTSCKLLAPFTKS